MGMFDTVNFICPSCGGLIPEQTKDGECNLREISSQEVPPDIAMGMDGAPVWCPHCNEQFKVKSSTIMSVKLTLEKGEL